MKSLFENPFILVILIGIISSVYKKMKLNEPEDGKRRSPLSQRVPSSFENPVLQNKRVKEHDEQRKNAKQQQKARKKPNTIYDEMITTETSNVGEVTQKTPKEKAVNLQARVNSPKEKQVQIDQSTLIEGIIWSEVLGPPRAKQPYRSINRR